ncbi:hypothetical protein GUJ93_ZPchr0005g15917 [Zizania palustris]|uniref:Uncharacterized protein n=1 Tax=Zizania palustris TaxID=103762 RepID=A0A8J5W0L8_ZIZPA|nr:hypothetical protein GUJ93_ZPchr0005g15917 [Zizania palustris]
MLSMSQGGIIDHRSALHKTKDEAPEGKKKVNVRIKDGHDHYGKSKELKFPSHAAIALARKSLPFALPFPIMADISHLPFCNHVPKPLL